MCIVYDDLQARKYMAHKRDEHHEVMRLQRETRDHLEKCAVCAGVTELYQQLWRGARVGVDIYQGAQ